MATGHHAIYAGKKTVFVVSVRPQHWPQLTYICVMKRTILNSIVAIALVLGACNQTSINQIGDPVNSDEAVSVGVGMEAFQKEGKAEAVLFGKVAEVCQAEGCWLSYVTEDDNMVVDFGEVFTVPKNIANKDLYARGHFYRDTLEDKTIEIKFRATGVKFK